jgi:carbon-monoxide dehydrogenase iron sulfur subunit
MRIVVTDPEYCVACRNCEYACAFVHGGDFDRGSACITVGFYPDERACLPLTCLHCTRAWCLEVCPAGAITRHPGTGAIEIDASRCAGCKMCLLACPFGSVRFDADEGVARKCDLCGGDPACVRSCTAGALQYREADEASGLRRETVEARLRAILRHETDEP